nr:hypothetical protein [Micromonospora sp. DSM 115978]
GSECGMRFITGFFVFFLVFYYGIPAMFDDPGVLASKAGLLFLVVVTGALLFALVPALNELLYGRKSGGGDGKCEHCGGSGRAGYDLAKYNRKEPCRTCKGTGSGPGGPGRPAEE